MASFRMRRRFNQCWVGFSPTFAFRFASATRENEFLVFGKSRSSDAVVCSSERFVVVFRVAPQFYKRLRFTALTCGKSFGSSVALLVSVGPNR